MRVVLTLMTLLLLGGWGTWVVRDVGIEQVGTIEAISEALFGTWMLPFQATILLLTIAAVGSIALARYEPRSESPRKVVVVPPIGEAGGFESAEPPQASQSSATFPSGERHEDGGDE